MVFHCFAPCFTALGPSIPGTDHHPCTKVEEVGNLYMNPARTAILFFLFPSLSFFLPFLLLMVVYVQEAAAAEQLKNAPLNDKKLLTAVVPWVALTLLKATNSVLSVWRLIALDLRRTSLICQIFLLVSSRTSVCVLTLTYIPIYLARCAAFLSKLDSAYLNQTMHVCAASVKAEG